MENGKIIVCRCEDVTLAEIRQLIEEGFTSLDEIKRIARCGMGPCQGKTCSQIIAREIAAATGKSLEEIQIPTNRPPIGGIKLGELVGEENEE
ncbi:(2Fe-2S)-binding protein [Anoxybacter fermentans]|uniref:(2Fe-2S)-binding protein n=1 Tax=Anoxybacter fermentans TaxID=1323375 RepID=A0A3Q9HPG8_9FIRM|nr:(2Fe-2S)-binding protein [Anoxybacter fermentans]AZR72472.1 (2Fe-2S)-binding protein [Anoxybacter fermentans]